MSKTTLARNSMPLPSHVRIVEVGPRDGLQNEKCVIDIDTKVTLIERLADAGFTYIEAGSFVNPTWVPQMANSDEVFQKITRSDAVTYAALTPNIKGFERAIKANATEVAIFGSASETFSQKNINCSIAESLERFKPVMQAAKAQNIRVRGYVSCVAGCPYEGDMPASKVAEVASALYKMGCYEISLGDTIGVGIPALINTMINCVAESVPIDNIAVHFHDTYGQALANIYAALQCGVSVIDSSIAGLGGCPYAEGASGNVATEDVLYLLKGLNIETGINLSAAIAAGNYISDRLGRKNGSKVARAMSA